MGQADREAKEALEVATEAAREEVRKEYETKLWHLDKEYNRLHREKEQAVGDAAAARRALDANQASAKATNEELMQLRATSAQVAQLSQEKATVEAKIKRMECSAVEQQEAISHLRAQLRAAEEAVRAKPAPQPAKRVDLDALQLEHDRVLERPLPDCTHACCSDTRGVTGWAGWSASCSALRQVRRVPFPRWAMVRLCLLGAARGCRG